MRRKTTGAQSRGVSHLSVAERDGSCFVKRSLKCKGSFWLFSWESHALPLDHEHLTWRRWMWNTSQTRNQTIWGSRTCSNVIPSSKYCTVESLESLGSKSAIRGAMYCVAVSIRWVMSPVKMNPGKKKRARWKKICKTWIWLVTFLQNHFSDLNMCWKGHLNICYKIKTYPLLLW